VARKKRKRTPEQLEELRRFEQESAENLRRLRELVDKGWRELEARRRAVT